MPINTQKGFTLMELMIVVAVIAILAMVALPSYQEQLKKSRRVDATTALVEIAQKQESFRADNNTYSSTLTLTFFQPYANGKSREGYYDLSLENVSSRAFTVVATPNSGKAQKDDDKCTRFTLNSRGEKGGSNPDCW